MEENSDCSGQRRMRQLISLDNVPEQTAVESVGSKKGEHFYSATGEPIPNLTHQVPMIMLEGTARGILMCAALVSKPLASVKIK